VGGGHVMDEKLVCGMESVLIWCRELAMMVIVTGGLDYEVQ